MPAKATATNCVAARVHIKHYPGIAQIAEKERVTFAWRNNKPIIKRSKKTATQVRNIPSDQSTRVFVGRYLLSPRVYRFS